MTPEQPSPATDEKISTDTTANAVPASSIRRLFKNASIYAIGHTLLSILSFVTDPILSHLLTVADFGLISLTRAFTNFSSNFYRVGLDGAANRIYYATEHDETARRRALGTINTFLLGWTLLLTIIQEIFGPSIYRRLFGDISYYPYGRFVTYTLLCTTLISVAQSVWVAQERAKLLAGIRFLTALFSSVITFGLLFTTNLGVISVFAAQIASSTIMLVGHWRHTYRSLGLAWDPQVMRKALAFGLPMVVHQTSHWALDLADRLLLEKLANRNAVGVYAVAYGTTSSLFMINSSINSAYVPQFVRSFGKPEQRDFIARAITYALLITTVATLGFVIFAPTMIRGLYASKFADAATLTPILALAGPLQAIYLIQVAVLFQAERTRIIPVLTLLSGLANIGLNIWWIPKYGILGAAGATVIGYGALAALFSFGARRVVALPFEKRLGRLFVTFVVISVLAVGIDGRLSIGLEILAKMLIALAAPILLLATGFLTAEERTLVREKLQSTLAWFRR
ncbi:MAG: oligosaccharide flippase family protein [Polyangiaceae bacterium]|nr:oligosaccharide flippase family protein [Polyangiaceae bacterium]